MRFRTRSRPSTRWVDREIAHAGKCLYPAESSYTGLIALDPLDPTLVFFSTDVDPSSGKDLGGKHEIYRAKVGPSDDITTIRWQPVTTNSPVRIIPPMILRAGDQRVVLWNRGRYKTFKNYDLDTVGLIEAAPPADPAARE